MDLWVYIYENCVIDFSLTNGLVRLIVCFGDVGGLAASKELTQGWVIRTAKVRSVGPLVPLYEMHSCGFEWLRGVKEVLQIVF